MTNELNYIPQNRDGILCASSLSLSLSMCACECQKGARVREKRGHRGISSFLSSPRRMVVHRLLIRFIFNSTERKAIVRGHDSSRCVKTVGSYIGFSLSTKMEQETKRKKKKRKECLVKEIGLDATTTTTTTQRCNENEFHDISVPFEFRYPCL